MYNFYEMRNIKSTCLVFLCAGTKKQVEEFRTDAEKLHLECRDLKPFGGKQIVLAVDRLDNGMHQQDLDTAELSILRAGGIPEELLPNKITGSIPEEREVSVYTVWQVWGRDTITVSSTYPLQKALNDYLRTAPLPESEYVNESQEIDYATGFRD